MSKVLLPPDAVEFIAEMGTSRAWHPNAVAVGAYPGEFTWLTYAHVEVGFYNRSVFVHDKRAGSDPGGPTSVGHTASTER